MRLLVTGGRNYTDRAAAFARLDEIHEGPYGPVTEVIEGGATGGDALARAWSRQRLGKPSTSCPADWSNIDAPGAVVRHRSDGRAYNVKAGFDRNQSMIDDHKPDACAPLPGGSGTADMVERAKAAGLLVL